MNIKRTLFWAAFIIILALIIWGLVVAINKTPGADLSSPSPITAEDHVTGPVDAPVTMIEYSDFQCPACQNIYPLVSRVVASSSVRFVYRHFPLDGLLANGQVQHPNAVIAAVASEAAAQQGKFWEMYDLLFQNHRDWTELKDAKPVFLGYAKTLNLNIDQFTADLASSTLTAKVQAQKDDGIKIGVNSTPTFFVNGKAIKNPQSYDEFKALIDAAAKANTP